jgi:hypothetical protein
MFAPLLEGHRLEGLLPEAKRCYRLAAASKESGATNFNGPGPAEADREDADVPLPAILHFQDEAAGRLWAELTASPSSMLGPKGGASGGGASYRQSYLTLSSTSSSSFLSLGVPWYRLAAALQSQLKEMLLRKVQAR